MKELRTSQRLVIAVTCAVFAGGITFLLQKNRDYLFENSWHGAYGAFDPREDKNLLNLALAAQAAEMRGTTCVGNWVGKDERYAYVTVGCGVFRKEGGRIAVTGDQNFRPVRYRRDGFELGRGEAADPKMLENSVRRLFPKEAMGRLEVRLNSQTYREAGLAKQLGAPAPAPPPPPPAPVPTIPAN